eukprot:symbB.v1.2.025362.t1/scaffold2456.1/size78816/3
MGVPRVSLGGNGHHLPLIQAPDWAVTELMEAPTAPRGKDPDMVPVGIAGVPQISFMAGMLIAKSDCNVGLLAGALKNKLLNGENPIVLQAIGPRAQLRSLKAMVFASRYLHDARPGLQVAAEPRFGEVPPVGDLPGTKSICFYMSLVPEQVLAEAAADVVFLFNIFARPFLGTIGCPLDQADMMFAKHTNPGLAASELVEKLQQRNLVTLSGMGEGALSMALKALIIARTYLKLEDHEALIAAPSLQDVGEYKRILLQCQRGPSRRG